MTTPAEKVIEEFKSDPAARAEGLWCDLFAGKRPNGLTLEGIAVDPPALRGAGVGSRALRALIGYADKHDVTLDLKVGHDEEGIDLVAWYVRHGFVWRDCFMERSPTLPPRCNQAKTGR